MTDILPKEIVVGISQGYNMWNALGDDHIILDNEAVYVRKDAVQIRFIAGWGSTEVPERVKQALKLIVNHWYCNRSGTVVGTISKELEHTITPLLGSLGYGQYS